MLLYGNGPGRNMELRRGRIDGTAPNRNPIESQVERVVAGNRPGGTGPEEVLERSFDDRVPAYFDAVERPSW